MMAPENTEGWPEQPPRELEAYLRNIAQTVRQPLLVLDRCLRVVFSNHAYDKAFPSRPRFCETKDGPGDLPALRPFLTGSLPGGERIEDVEATHDFPGLGERTLLINASRMGGAGAIPELILLALEDVTERRQTEQSLRESEARYRSLFEFSPLPSWVADRENFRFLAVNQAAIEHYGYSREEFLHLTVPDIRLEQEAASLADCFGQSAAPFSGPEIAQHRHKDGTVVDVEIRRHPLVYKGRDARLVVATDISERRRAEQELESKTRQIITVWESMSDAFYAVDTAWRFTYINAQGEALLKRTRGSLLGKILWDEFPGATDLAYFAQYRRAMTDQVPVTFEEFSPPLDSWFEVHAHPSPVGLSVYFRDITERRRSAATLQKSVDMLQAVTEGTTDAVFVKDREGRYLMVNTAGARIMGAMPAEILGQDDTAFFDEAMTGSIRENDLETMRQGVAYTYEETGTSGGVTRTFLATKAPYRNIDGAVIGVIGISRDITELKRLQNQLAQAERLAAMGEMVTGVAHELNNPLAAISGNAQLLQNHPDETVRADAQTIKLMTDRAARIVRSLVTFSRQADNAERRPLSLHTLIDGTLEMIRYKLRKGKVEVVLDLADADLFPPVVSGRIEQVLLNLISNAEYALRERPEEREIRIATKTVFHERAEWATLSVSDNAYGIPEHDIGRVFDPFFTTKPQGEGTGLGLSICHGILEEHGGRLTVSSREGAGTTFTLWLPLLPALPALPLKF